MEGQYICKQKWKCLNCDILMCNKCKDKIHVQLKFAKDQTVINLKDVGKHREALNFLDFTCGELACGILCEKLKFSDHAGQSSIMFCILLD